MQACTGRNIEQWNVERSTMAKNDDSTMVESSYHKHINLIGVGRKWSYSRSVYPVYGMTSTWNYIQHTCQHQYQTFFIIAQNSTFIVKRWCHRCAGCSFKAILGQVYPSWQLLNGRNHHNANDSMVIDTRSMGISMGELVIFFIRE